MRINLVGFRLVTTELTPLSCVQQASTGLVHLRLLGGGIARHCVGIDSSLVLNTFRAVHTSCKIKLEMRGRV